MADGSVDLPPKILACITIASSLETAIQYTTAVVLFLKIVSRSKSILWILHLVIGVWMFVVHDIFQQYDVRIIMGSFHWREGARIFCEVSFTRRNVCKLVVAFHWHHPKYLLLESTWSPRYFHLLMEIIYFYGRQLSHKCMPLGPLWTGSLHSCAVLSFFACMRFFPTVVGLNIYIYIYI